MPTSVQPNKSFTQPFTPIVASRIEKLQEELLQLSKEEEVYAEDKLVHEKNLKLTTARLETINSEKNRILADISTFESHIEVKSKFFATIDNIIDLRASATFFDLPRGIGKTEYAAKLGADIRKGVRKERLALIVRNNKARSDILNRMEQLRANIPVDTVQIYTVNEVEQGTCYILPTREEVDHTVIILDSIGPSCAHIVPKFVSHNTGVLQMKSVSAIFLDSSREA